MFGDEFRRYIEDDLIKREPHPDAFSLGEEILARESHEAH